MFCMKIDIVHYVTAILLEMNFIIYLYAWKLHRKYLNILTNIMWIDQMYTNSDNSSTLNGLVFFKTM